MAVLKPVHVTLTLDTSAFEAALQKAAEGMREFQRSVGRFGRSLSRRGLTPGERHIDKIVRDCLARRLSVEEMTLRLYVAAACVAPVLDGEE